MNECPELGGTEQIPALNLAIVADIPLSLLYFFNFLLSGFDNRQEWSHAPFLVVIVADIFVLLGYGLVFLVFREHSYESRIIEVEQDQKVRLEHSLAARLFR